MLRTKVTTVITGKLQDYRNENNGVKKKYKCMLKGF